jgi:hypothetical protein
MALAHFMLLSLTKAAHAAMSSAAWQEIRVGMTKGMVGFPLEIGCRDPRSQKRDLGHPSIVSDTDLSPTGWHGYKPN